MWTTRQIYALATNPVRRQNAFPSDGKPDEFMITRETGEEQGIFKAWAQPVLSTLSGMEETSWRSKARRQPAFLEKELRRAQRNSWLIDRDLAAEFKAHPLPKDSERRVLELVRRLKLAFGLMAPFYHLEAMVDDLPWLGIEVPENQAVAGELDVAAFLLPSALQRFVVATTGNWNGLDWPTIHRLTATALTSASLARTLLGLSGLLGVSPAHLVFAANVLEWIPTRVGGKKEDVREHEAIRGLEEVIERSRKTKDLNCLSVLADMNARIRFFNWLPLIEGPENFEGKNWTYASVCDTTEELFRTLDKHPELWLQDFREVWEKVLRPQVLDLDAASAKGRLLLDLIVNEKRLAVSLKDEIRSYHYGDSDRLIPHATDEFKQPCLVGTKTIGLTLAAHVLGQEHMLPSLVISMSSVENLQPEQLANEALGHWPEVELWAVRSSSMDEGTARGVYETILKVPRRELETAIGACIQSYHQKSAVAFRRVKGLDEVNPRVEIAVLLQPYQAGRSGGVATIANAADGSGEKYHISVAQTAEQVTSGGETEEYEFSADTQVPDDFTSLVSILDRLHEVFGGTIQIEWVLDNAGKIIVLQMELLPTTPSEDRERDKANTEAIEVSVDSMEDIDGVIAEIQRTDGDIRLVIGSEVDLGSFHGELIAMVMKLGKRIKEISHANRISHSSHLANICRHFGIRLV